MKKILFGTLAAATLIASATAASAQMYPRWNDNFGYSQRWDSGYGYFDRSGGGSVGYNRNIYNAKP